MKHWKTKEEMGEGFQHNEDEHHDCEYNSLIRPYPEDDNTMRTKYIIQDIWTNTQIKDIVSHCLNTLEQREEPQPSKKENDK